MLRSVQITYELSLPDPQKSTGGAAPGPPLPDPVKHRLPVILLIPPAWPCATVKATSPPFLRSRFLWIPPSSLAPRLARTLLLLCVAAATGAAVAWPEQSTPNDLLPGAHPSPRPVRLQGLDVGDVRLAFGEDLGVLGVQLLLRLRAAKGGGGRMFGWASWDGMQGATR